MVHTTLLHKYRVLFAVGNIANKVKTSNSAEFLPDYCDPVTVLLYGNVDLCLHN